jgi:hypothetical protein
MNLKSINIMKTITNPAKKFYVQNGIALSSLKELADNLETKGISKDQFDFHAQRGDFSNWITEVIEEPKLANALKKIKTAKSYIKKIREN